MEILQFLASALVWLIQFIIDALVWVVHVVVALLPESPLAGFDWGSLDVVGLGWLNWVFPMGQFLILLGAWAAAMALWFVARALLRFFHLQ